VSLPPFFRDPRCCSPSVDNTGPSRRIGSSIRSDSPASFTKHLISLNVTLSSCYLNLTIPLPFLVRHCTTRKKLNAKRHRVGNCTRLQVRDLASAFPFGGGLSTMFCLAPLVATCPCLDMEARSHLLMDSWRRSLFAGPASGTRFQPDSGSLFWFHFIRDELLTSSPCLGEEAFTRVGWRKGHQFTV